MSASTFTSAISLDSFRRRMATKRSNAVAGAAAREGHPLVGIALGALVRRYGLMSSEETVTVAEVLASSGDLAVADRLAFIASMAHAEPIVVIEIDGWYLACRTDRPLDPAQLPQLRAIDSNTPRIMSVACERGITPALGPLVAGGSSSADAEQVTA